MTAKLFTPIQLGGVTLPNRIVVSPMCQYSAADGAMSDWHLAHLGTFACSGAGLFIIEATGVTREGRISNYCTGLYHDLNEAAMKRAVDLYRDITKSPIGVQLAHAGRKGSAQQPWLGGKALGPGESPWQTVAPSALPFAEGWHVPHELTAQEIQGVVDAFAAAAQRAKRIGLDLVELHAAHGYLLHQFLSPLSNKRTDRYGGSLENRMRAPLDVARAVREAWPKERALGARITASDWTEGGFEAADAAVFAKALKAIGLDYVCVTSGGVVNARIKLEAGYQVGFAETVKRGAGLPTMAVGLIVEPQQAEDIVASGRADMVALARGFLDNPRWVWHAAERFGAKHEYPPQYRRLHPDQWPGARLVRPLAAEALPGR
ncbi:MAG: NADH:flavin oxidoreductase/NADH oxidase [Betaproteobacteria bacterium]|nr:NADH:flavin oxidoreductase/NADH oxidase [Betaproteobacteria bacterium]MDH5222291.1 NADH:flavin oxidoreductase/NADH oxidase [Betaproteobacteria bacterium]MDH5351026.1 NADH:flavin oxidoreductase/NADH oxidase [Betaproteobacteria bacterium]